MPRYHMEKQVEKPKRNWVWLVVELLKIGVAFFTGYSL